MSKKTFKKKTLTASRMIELMVEAHLDGTVLSNVAPFSSWLQKVTKAEMRDYAKGMGIVLRDNWTKLDLIDVMARETRELEAKKRDSSLKEGEKVALEALLDIIKEQGLNIVPEYGVNYGDDFRPVRITFDTGDKVHFVDFDNAVTYLSGVFTSLKVQKDLRVKAILNTGKEAE